MNYSRRRLSRPSIPVSTLQLEPEIVYQPEQDVHMDSDSPDELNIMSEEELQAEALMFSALMDFGANAGLEMCTFYLRMPLNMCSSPPTSLSMCSLHKPNNSLDLSHTNRRTSKADLMHISGKRLQCKNLSVSLRMAHSSL